MSELPMFMRNDPGRNKAKLALIAIGAVVVIGGFVQYVVKSISNSAEPYNPDELCPLAPKLEPTFDRNTVDRILHDSTFRNNSIDRWAGSVRIPTVLYDDTITPATVETVEELYELEPLWKNFEKLHKHLKKSFPLVHKHLTVEKVNKFGLVYTWKGSTNKKPLLLAAHQDVVPVDPETVDNWVLPPFSGAEKDGYLYGRGSADCKSLLTALLESVEILLQENSFKPKRTLVLAFGYDEESQGTGAKSISQFLEKRYGSNSFYMIIDEGAKGYIDYEGTKFIPVSTGEKGYLDSVIDLFTPGGHSSVPPKHTSIGIMGRLAEKIESKEFDSILTNSNPMLHLLQCFAEHSNLDKSLKSDILKAHLDVKANSRVLDYLDSNPSTKFLVKTSQAIDVIHGGVKANALPEHVSMLVNHRITIGETVQTTIDKVVNDITFVAKQFDLGVIIDGKTLVEPTQNGFFNYSGLRALEAAPVTPQNSQPWNTFAGSLRYLYEDVMHPESDEIYYFAPSIMAGNTDTKFYWNLSTNIFRYIPGGPLDGPAGIHSINEKASIDEHLLVIGYYYYFIPLVDEADDADDADV